MIRLVISDDHELFRIGIKSLFINQNTFEIVGEAENGIELLNILRKTKTDIILLDYSMPRLSGKELIKAIKEEFPRIKILMLSANSDEKSIVSSIRSGANGYIHKDVCSKELMFALTNIHNGESYFSNTIAPIVNDYQTKSAYIDSECSEKSLSYREIDVLKLLAEGLSYKEIGENLAISPRTVETHKKNISQKLGLSSTAEIVKWAINNRII
ncbi:MAG: response regulator transcription factor [Bacteroidota bacterium]